VSETAEPEVNIGAYERALLELSGRLDLPYRSSGLFPIVVMALAHRARSLYEGFTYCIEGPAPVAALTFLRPMIEINILLRFLRQHPKERTKLWVFERHRWSINVTKDVRADPTLNARLGENLPTDAQIEVWRDEVEAVRAEAQAAGIAGVPARGPLLPTVSEQVRLLNDPAATEAYVMGYRQLSGDVHSGAVAFDHVKRTELEEGWAIHSDERTADELYSSRVLASTTYASTLVIVSHELDMNIAEAADRIRAVLMASAPVRD
jgi:hypothetical protein